MKNRKLKIVVPITRMSGKMGNLTSWLEQLPEDDFIITLIHDIGDKETALELAQLIAKLKNERIVFQEVKFGSPGLARNVGLKKLDFEWINFSDSDDLVDVRQILKMIENSSPETEILVGDYWVDLAGKKLLKLDSARKDPFKAVSLNPGIWRMVFNQQTVRNIEFIQAKMAEDQYFLLQIYFFDRNVQFMSNIPYTYFANFQGQATQNVESIAEISKVIPLTLNSLNASNSHSLKYVMVLYVRQIVTEFTNGYSNSRTGSVFRLAGRLLDLRFRQIPIMIWALITIVESKVRK